ncbi:LGALS3BP isoform 17 [Pan troglodytes]|uniref:LGALS3BP isoform 15 n=1 Tax=Pan troglodytes TaxID=9598 RepID=A0A2J8K879_PANTR|nr:LGALS3BP isoform 15 [Pan troglodytes]PNI31169.1 LGALS3BP isoform 17 [Pan troglodytes]
MTPPRLFWVWLLVAGTQGELSPWEIPKAEAWKPAAPWGCSERQGDVLPGARGPAVSQVFSPA